MTLDNMDFDLLFIIRKITVPQNEWTIEGFSGDLELFETLIM